MVAMVLYSYVEAENVFTAYDITKMLREARPDLYVRHAEVRQAVHDYMGTVVQCGLYGASLHDFGGRVALLYEPAAKVRVLQVPFRSLN